MKQIKIFPEFTSSIEPSRTESIDSDVIYNQNGKIKQKFLE